MKLCPNCREELPDAAHVCLKCLYQLEKQDLDTITQQKQAFKLNKKAGVFVVAVLSMLFACVVIWNVGKLVSIVWDDRAAEYDTDGAYVQAFPTEPPAEEKGYEQEFPSESSVGENHNIQVDCRDMLASYEEVRKLFGEETEEVAYDADFELHTFGGVTLAVNDSGDVQYLMVDYSSEMSDTEYGIMGIGSLDRKETVKGMLGTPKQEYGDEELVYDFYRDTEPYHTYLHIYFGASGTVEQLEYYYHEGL